MTSQKPYQPSSFFALIGEKHRENVPHEKGADEDQEMVQQYGPCILHGCMHAPHAVHESKGRPQHVTRAGKRFWTPGLVGHYTSLEKVSGMLNEEVVFAMFSIEDFGIAFDAAGDAIGIYEHYRNAKTLSEEDLVFLRAWLAAQVQHIRALAKNFAPSLLNDFDFGVQSISADFATYLSAWAAEGFRYAMKKVKG